MLPAPRNGRSRTDAFRAWDSGPPDRLFKSQTRAEVATPLLAAIFSHVNALNALIARLPTTMKQLFSYMPTPSLPLQRSAMPAPPPVSSARPAFGSPPRAISDARMASPSWRSPIPISSPPSLTRCTVHNCKLRMAHSHFVVQQHPRIDRISFRFPTPAAPIPTPDDSKRAPTTVIPGTPARAPLAAAVPVAAAAAAVAAVAVAVATPSRSLKRSGDDMSTPPPRFPRTSTIGSPAAGAALLRFTAVPSSSVVAAIADNSVSVESKEEKKSTAEAVVAISGSVACMHFTPNHSHRQPVTATIAPAIDSLSSSLSSPAVVVAPAATPLMLQSPAPYRPPPFRSLNPHELRIAECRGRMIRYVFNEEFIARRPYSYRLPLPRLNNRMRFDPNRLPGIPTSRRVADRVTDRLYHPIQRSKLPVFLGLPMKKRPVQPVTASSNALSARGTAVRVALPWPFA